MKKLLLSSTLGIGLVFAGVGCAFAYTYYSAPNGGNQSFLPLMQHQMEKEETLDFASDPEKYKEKRDAKDAVTGTPAGNANFNPSYQPNYRGTYSQHIRPVKMNFVQDENGNIKIQAY